MNHIISFLDPDQREAEEIDEEIMHTLCNLHRVFPGWTICTCRFMHTNFFYVSDNFRDLLGLEPATGIEAFHLDSFFDRVHPADAADFNKGIHLLEALLKKEDPADHHRFRFVFHYRVLHTDGRYICIHDEKAVIRLKNGRCLYFMLLKDISHENTYAGFKMTAYKEGYSEKVLEYYAAAEASAQLTPRESELIPLMKQGLSIKEAAACLGISPNTVRNMRQKLFEKFQVNNVIELLNRLDVNGLATAV